MQKPYTSGKKPGTVKVASQGRIKSIVGRPIPKAGNDTSSDVRVAHNPYKD